MGAMCSKLDEIRFTNGRFKFGIGAGVGIGSSPPPGIRLGMGVAGANNDKAFASSGIFPVLVRYWSWTIRYQAWTLSRGAIVSQCWNVVQHKTTPMAASLIAHRTSDTEKNNKFRKGYQELLYYIKKK